MVSATTVLQANIQILHALRAFGARTVRQRKWQRMRAAGRFAPGCRAKQVRRVPCRFIELSDECVRCDASKEPALDGYAQCDLDGIGVDGQCVTCDEGPTC